MRSKEMHVKMPRNTVAVELEVMMLEVGEAVRHVFFARLNRLVPYLLAIALNTDFTSNGGEISAGNELWADAAVTQLRSRKIQIVVALELVIGKFIAHAKTDTVRRPIFS